MTDQSRITGETDGRQVKPVAPVEAKGNGFVPPPGFVVDPLFSGLALDGRAGKHKRRFARKPPRPFMELPLRKRRDLTASLRWRIRSDPDGQGVFTTHQILPGSRAWREHGTDEGAISHWADFLFVSDRHLSHGLFYNAYAHTVAMDAATQIVRAAEVAVQERLDKHGIPISQAQPIVYSKPMPDGGAEMIWSPAPTLAALDGLTLDGAKAQWLREHWDSLHTLAQVRPTMQVKRDYCYGVGLEMVVDQSRVDVYTIPDIIADFRAGGEVSQTGPVANLVSHRALIEALLKVDLWHFDATQARATGQPKPDIDDDVRQAFNYRSQARR